MLLFLLSNSLNAIYLNLSKIDISIINVYPVNLMYVVILFWEQLWVQDISVTLAKAKVFQSVIRTQIV